MLQPVSVGAYVFRGRGIRYCTTVYAFATISRKGCHWMERAVADSSGREDRMTDISELLPIGSIVLLKDGEKRLMVSGVLQSEKDRPEQVYDYLGLFYPEGNIGEEYQYFFNHEDIEDVIFIGYTDEERTEFLKRLSEVYNAEKPKKSVCLSGGKGRGFHFFRRT